MDALRAHLASVLASDTFRRAPHSSALLRYLVDSTLSNTVPKEYAIGTEALGRPPGFDPRTDPSVRVEVRRLRQKLLEYYEGPGAHSDVVIDIPKGGYAIALSHREQAAQAAAAAVAVLPFVNLTGDAAKEYFVDGLTEELTSELARSPELRVVARTSAFLFKERAEDVREIGRRLNVASLVEGSVRWSEGRARVTAQLVETRTGFHRWAHSSEVCEQDVLRCQQELAARIREALLPRLVQPAMEPAETGPPTAEAYALFLRARFHWHTRSREGIDKALRLLEELTTRFPGYAAPWAALGECYCVLGLDGHHDVQGVGTAALECSARALMLAPNLAEAHAAEGWARGEYCYDHAAGERHLKRAIELKPSYVSARYVWAMAACALHRFDEGLRHAQAAAACDPLSMTARRGVAYAHFVQGDYNRAREEVLAALELAPGAPFALYLQGMIEAEAGNDAEGIEILRDAIRLSGGSWPVVEGLLAYYLSRAGRCAEADGTARALLASDHRDGLALALAALARRDTDGVIHHLELAREQGNAMIVHIADLPAFRRLSTEPRYRSLCARLNLPAG